MSSIKIDRAFLRTFTGDAEKALTEVADKYGIKISYKGGSFARDGGNATLKFEIAAPNAQGETLSREAQDFKRFATQFGFKSEDLGSEFKVGSETYRITGLKTSRHKFPISAARVKDSKNFKFSAEVVLANFLGPHRPMPNRRAAIEHEKSKAKAGEGLTPEIKSAFARLTYRLSPENLTCDGECSASEVSCRRDAITREWSELERRSGQKVSETEAWSFDNV